MAYYITYIFALVYFDTPGMY